VQLLELVRRLLESVQELLVLLESGQRVQRLERRLGLEPQLQLPRQGLQRLLVPERMERQLHRQ
jgi:hypothetical protein